MKITENIYVVPDVVANPYIIVDSDGLTIIDVGIPGKDKKILTYIASLGKSAQDVKRIILTHSDLDHVGSLSALQKATGARTYASKIEADAIALGKPSRQITGGGVVRKVLFAIVGPFFKAIPFQVDEILTEGQVLPEWRCVCWRLPVTHQGTFRCSPNPRAYCSAAIRWFRKMVCKAHVLP